MGGRRDGWYESLKTIVGFFIVYDIFINRGTGDVSITNWSVANPLEEEL